MIDCPDCSPAGDHNDKSRRHGYSGRTGSRKNRFIRRSIVLSRLAREATAAPTVGEHSTSANDAIVNTRAIGLPARCARRSPLPALLRLFFGFELLDDGDNDAQRLGDVQAAPASAAYR